MGTPVRHAPDVVIPAGAKRRAGIQNAAAFLDSGVDRSGPLRERGNDDFLGLAEGSAAAARGFAPVTGWAANPLETKGKTAK